MIDLGSAPQQRENISTDIVSNSIDIIHEFRQAMESAGIVTTSELVADGTLHRFMVEGDKLGSKNGFYVLFGDSLPAGQFGCFKRGVNEKWSARDFKAFTPEEKEQFSARMKAAQQQRDAHQARVQSECRAWCKNAYETAVEAPADHPYLVKKGIHPYGVKLLGENLMIPLRDVAGAPHGLQFISPDGTKRFKTGTAKKGNYNPIGQIKDNILLICEGYGTGASLHEATGHAVAVAFDAGNLLHVAKNLRNKFPEMKIVVCADHDASGVGQKNAKEAALAVGGVVVKPPDVCDDFNDLHQKKGLEAIRLLMAAALNPQKAGHGFKFVSSANLSFSNPKWLIKDYLEEDSLSDLFGAAGSMKTFLAMDWGLHLATGKSWNGSRVKKCPVLYICGEGKSGIVRRVRSWEIHHDKKAPNFYVSNMAAQLLDNGNVDFVVAAAKEIENISGAPGLVIIDTLNRNFGAGDENSTVDMTKFVHSVDTLKNQLKCTVLVVHHTGLADAGRGRGSSALRGSLDFEYSCEKSGDTTEEQVVTLACTKTKDHESPMPKSFKPIVVDLGLVDEDLQPITSLILELTDEKPAKKKKLSLANQIAFDALRELTANGNDVSEDSWRQESYSQGIAPSDESSAKRQAFLRARKFLIENFYVATRNDFYWILNSKTGRDKRDTNVTCHDLSRSSTRDKRDTTLRGVTLVTPDDEKTRQKEKTEKESFHGEKVLEFAESENGVFEYEDFPDKNCQDRSLSIKMSLLVHHCKGSFSLLPHSASLVC